MQSILANLTNLVQLKGNLYVSDLLDILIIGLLIYTLFIFLRRTKTYMVFFGIAIAIGLYVVAASLNLYLTLLTLRYFAGISVIVLVLIFQTEIRKYFEFLGLLGTRQIKVGPLATRSPTTTEILQAMVKMAHEKIGALIVIQGKDSMDTFIDGGVALDGVISEEILLSIFDPHSEGHDGALLINNNRIAKFGAHLPLSTNFKEIGKHGTRHSAALGLTETTDSLCIVASEEKGTISVCRDGKMKTLGEYSDLEKEIEKFIKAKFTPKSESLFVQFVKNDLWLKVGALMLAAVIWFATAYRAGIIQRTYTVPITFDKLPKDTVIQSYNPKEINITVSGRGNSVFQNIEGTDFKVNVDASTLQNGTNKETVTKKNIIVPSRLSVTNFEPTSFLLTAQKYYVATIPVKVKTKGTLAKDLELKDTLITPESVDLWIPIDTPKPSEISTEVVDISTQTESVIIPVKIIVPEDMKLVNGDATVNVAFTIDKKQQ